MKSTSTNNAAIVLRMMYFMGATANISERLSMVTAAMMPICQMWSCAKTPTVIPQTIPMSKKPTEMTLKRSNSARSLKRSINPFDSVVVEAIMNDVW